MADRIELFERRNRLRIVALVLLATLNYIVAVVMAAIALGIGIALAIIFQGDAFVDADPSRAAQRLARELLLDERIDDLRELAGESARPVTQ